MNHNVTQENVAGTTPLPDTNDEEDCCPGNFEVLSLSEERETLRQLGEIKYNPRKETIHSILKYAGGHLLRNRH